MQQLFFVISAVFIFFIVCVVWIYNRLVKARRLVAEAFSTMDVYLKKRWDLIPNLVAVVKSYAAHEKQTLESITALRTDIYDDLSTTQKMVTDEKLHDALAQILLVAENYPALQASHNFTQLSQQLVEVENEIAQARKYYNAVVKLYNTQLETIPTKYLAMLFKFESAIPFHLRLGENKNVQLDF